MSRIAELLAVTAWVVMVLCTWGCGGDKMEAGENVPLETVQMECKNLKTPMLREKTVIYRDLILEKMRQVQALDAQIATVDLTVTTQDDLEKMKAAREAADRSRVALIERYQIYIKTLVRRGVNVSELRVEKPTGGEDMTPR